MISHSALVKYKEKRSFRTAFLTTDTYKEMETLPMRALVRSYLAYARCMHTTIRNATHIYQVTHVWMSGPTGIRHI